MKIVGGGVIVFLCPHKNMKMVLSGGVIVFFLTTAFFLRYGHLFQNDYLVVPIDDHLLLNFSMEQNPTLQTWIHMEMGNLVNQSRYLPNAEEAYWEGAKVWKTLKDSIEKKKRFDGNITKTHCPMSMRKMNSFVFNDGVFKFNIPCGLVQGSSITLIATPGVLHGNFHIDLAGATLPDEPKPPIILHYNVQLHGDMTTGDPIIVQNTWTASQDWGAEERCPDSNEGVLLKK